MPSKSWPTNTNLTRCGTGPPTGLFNKFPYAQGFFRKNLVRHAGAGHTAIPRAGALLCPESSLVRLVPPSFRLHWVETEEREARESTVGYSSHQRLRSPGLGHCPGSAARLCVDWGHLGVAGCESIHSAFEWAQPVPGLVANSWVDRSAGLVVRHG
jgi:hypothetical protein